MKTPKLKKAAELFRILNESDECNILEAKGHSDSSRTLLETVCSFSNEPGLGGGYILLGIGEGRDNHVHSYEVEGVENVDKAQLDIATQCKGVFNHPVYPEITVEKLRGKNVLKIWVDELGDTQKPLYFKKDGLPRGAYRRVGSADLRCTEDDLHVFYEDKTSSYDQTPVKGATVDDVDEVALRRYRDLRSKTNPAAEELTYDDQELLEALGCVDENDRKRLNLAGVLLFGTAKLQRRVIPMARVDYIRVPGNAWVETVDDTFQSIDMRGSLLLVLFRLVDAINADLPKGFLLKEGEIQAESIGLPVRALREALVNAMMHRSYRENRPVQVIRYDNRIEIVNSGFSLKAAEYLGRPGSETRNKIIAPVFHDTNLAETKGTGIKRMRNSMRAAHLALPTFDSNREENTFTTRLLLHHFLGSEDIAWLERFSDIHLNDHQKTALIFLREVGALDNMTYRQMSNCETLKASSELRAMRKSKLLERKGKGSATYYVAGPTFNARIGPVSDQAGPVSDQAIPGELRQRLDALGRRVHDDVVIRSLILELCRIRPMKRTELAEHLKRTEGYIKNRFLRKMIADHSLQYLYPNMQKHPDQAYMARPS